MSLPALSEYTFFSRYSQNYQGKKESWNEAVTRIFDTHRAKYAKEITQNPELEKLIDQAEKSQKDKKTLSSQRMLQTGGDMVLNRNERSFNCSALAIDKPKAFQDVVWLLLAGCGVGFSVQKFDIDKLPKLSKPSKKVKTYTVPDTSEGWANSVGVLLSSYFSSGGYFSEYNNCTVEFDFSEIRPKGALVAETFKAPGPEPLEKGLKLIKEILEKVSKENRKLKPIEAHDIIMHCADFVVSGGIRRCLPEGSKVFLKNGVKNIEDVEIGDLALTSTGYYPITNKFYQGQQKLIKIVTQESEFECTPNHKMAVLTGVDEYKWVEAQNLKANDRLISNLVPIEGQETHLPDYKAKKLSKDNTSKDIKIPELDEGIAYLLGCIHADGYIRYIKNRKSYGKDSSSFISIATNSIETDKIEYLKTQMSRFGIPAKIKKRTNENCTNIVIHSKQLAEYFYTNFKIPNKNISIPQCIWDAEQHIKMSYLVGILESDGSPNNRPVTACTSVYGNFIKDLQTLYLSCGITTRLTKQSKNTKSRPSHWQKIYTLSIINEHDKKNVSKYKKFKIIRDNDNYRMTNSFPAELIKKDIRIKNKSKLGIYSNKNIPRDTLQKTQELNILSPIKVLKIEKSNTKETFDIEVDKAHEFFCNGILTHNSACISLFSPDDKEMAECKTGNWFEENPQRGRANNSAVIVRDEISKSDFKNIFQNTKEFGEPGWIFVDSRTELTNPCLPSWSKLLTQNGIKLLKDINIGDKIWSKEGFTTVTNKWSTGIKNVYEYKTEGSSFFSTENHEVYDRGNKVKVKDAVFIDEFRIGSNSQEVVPKKVLSNKFFSKEEVFDITVDNQSHTFWCNGFDISNCAEIKWDIERNSSKESVVGFCNLTEINGKYCSTKEKFLDCCENAAIKGTLQAGYTDFPYLGKSTENFAKELALLGVSITGWMENPDILFDPKILEEGAKVVKETNLKVSKLIGINPAARLCTAKPAGHTSCILSTSSGIHPHHAKRYIRRVQSNKQEETAKIFEQFNPIAVENSVWSANDSDVVISFLCEVPKGSITKNQISALELLEKVKIAQKHWVTKGTNNKYNEVEGLTHSVSNTITVKLEEWDEVENYIYKNRNYFSGISLLPASGDLDYPQAPFSTVLNETEIVKEYGEGSVLGSGLVVDGLSAFDNNLWRACEVALGISKIEDLYNEPEYPKKRNYKEISEYFAKREEYEKLFSQHDWVRRVKQFSDRYFEGNVRRTTYCLKHISLWKTWLDLSREYKKIPWSEIEWENNHKNVGDNVAMACSGGSCELQ